MESISSKNANVLNFVPFFFRFYKYLPTHPTSNAQKKEDQVAWIGVMGGGLGDSGNARKKRFFSFEAFPYMVKLSFFNTSSCLSGLTL